MAQLQVKPTRMELTNLKKKRKVAARGHKLLKTASRGHKLLKDKRDELMRQFMDVVRRNKELREQVEQKLSAAMGQFVLARAEMSGEAIEEALAYPARPATVSVDTQHVLSLKMPKLSLETSDTFDYPYGFMNTSAELDSAVSAFAEVLPMLIELAEVEKICNSLADEIEKTRRRVNALEYVMIPQFDEAIREIKMKLDENDRGNTTRLMKTKEMLANRE